MSTDVYAWDVDRGAVVGWPAAPELDTRLGDSCGAESLELRDSRLDLADSRIVTSRFSRRLVPTEAVVNRDRIFLRPEAGSYSPVPH